VIIPIDESRRIKGTEMCWQIERFHPASEKTEARWVPFKYYASFSQALSAAYQMDVRVAPAEGIKEALSACDSLSQQYGKIFDEFERHTNGGTVQ